MDADPFNKEQNELEEIQAILAQARIYDATILELFSYQSAESLPEEVGDLVLLETLFLTEWESLRVIPQAINHLHNLVNLHIWGCEQLEVLPEDMGFMRSLGFLSLRRCSRFTTLPRSLGNLSSLETLELTAMDKLTHLPDSLGDLSCLRRLSLYLCPILRTLPDSLGRLGSLEELEIRYCTSLEALPELDGLQSLTRLCIHHNECMAGLPESLGNLVQLQALQINQCDLLWDVPSAAFGHLVSLETLEIDSCRNLGNLPSIRSLQNLSRLEIAQCPTLTNLPEDLVELVNLCVLRLFCCHNLQSLPPGFGRGLRGLQHLHIVHCEGLVCSPNAVLLPELGQFANVTELWLSTDWNRLSTVSLPPKLNELHAPPPPSSPRDETFNKAVSKLLERNPYLTSLWVKFPALGSHKVAAMAINRLRPILERTGAPIPPAHLSLVLAIIERRVALWDGGRSARVAAVHMMLQKHAPWTGATEPSCGQKRKHAHLNKDY